MKKVNRNITEEEDSSQCLKFLTQSAIKDDIAPLSGIQKVYPIPGRSLDKLISPFTVFLKRPTKETWKRFRDRHIYPSFQNAQALGLH